MSNDTDEPGNTKDQMKILQIEVNGLKAQLLSNGNIMIKTIAAATPVGDNLGHFNLPTAARVIDILAIESGRKSVGVGEVTKQLRRLVRQQKSLGWKRTA